MAEKQPNIWKLEHVVPLEMRDDALKDLKVSRSADSEHAAMFAELLHIWHAKLFKNRIRERYYDGRNVLKDFGISIPPSLRTVETVVGWPQKAVDALAVRSRFDGFSAADPDVQREVDAIVYRSRLKQKYRQGVQSELVHSCEFATVTVDDSGASRIDFYSAQDGAGVWDDAAGRIAYGLVIDAYADNGVPSACRVFTSDGVCYFNLDSNNVYRYTFEPYSMGRPCMDVFAYRPTDKRPFGQSRISRAVRSITDSAVREALRTEVSAEFFTSPQKYLLGADSDAFANRTKWEAYIGNIFAVGRDENGEVPQFGQLPQGTMQPHTEYFRALAARFSGETNVPISTLGIIHDQPASAEAIYAASEPLIIECEDLNDNSRDTLRSLIQMAVAAEMDVPVAELPVETADIVANFKNPAMPSIVSQADAMVKLASVMPGFADTNVFLEQLGFSEDIVRRVNAERRQRDASALLDSIIAEEV